MQCTAPLQAIWYSPEHAAERPYSLDRPIIVGDYNECLMSHRQLCRDLRARHLPWQLSGYVRYMLLPCGKCLSCLLSRSAEWSFRACAELEEHSAASFLTLTVNDEHIDKVFPQSQLQHRYFQLFMKDFRIRLDREFSQANLIAPRIRYIMCGEYGSRTNRPHYHVILYGYDFPDREVWKYDDGHYLWRSSFLEDLWPYGFSTIGEVCQQTIQYVCRYVLKKATGSSGEYIRASNRPGIGYGWYQRYGLSELYAHQGLDFPNCYVNLGHNSLRVPRYFDKKFAKSHSVDYVSLQLSRQLHNDSLVRLSRCDLARMDDYIKTKIRGRILGDENHV